MKAIILTYAPVTEIEKKILIETTIYKLALNHHCSEYYPNARILTDYVLLNIYNRFPETIISVRDRLRTPSDRVIYFDKEFRGATIVSAVEYLISQNYNEILIVGNNRVNNIKFQNLVCEQIDELAERVMLYQYSNGNFNIPIKSITDFCS